MSLKKCIGLVTMAIVGGAFAVGCSSSDTAGGTPADSGTVTDTGVRRDSGTVTEDTGTGADAGGTCTPQPVTGYTPNTYKPAKQQNGACTKAEIDKIAADCSANLDAPGTVPACATDLTGAGVSATCKACVVTAESAASWGPFVQFAGDAGAGDIGFQNASCIDVVTGVPGCGGGYYAVVDCINLSCSDASCGTDPNAEPAASCGTAAIKSTCKAYVPAQACATGLGKPEIDTTCFGTPTAVITGVVNAQCGTPVTGTDAGPG